MPISVKDLQLCELGGRNYWFRVPTAYDLPKMRRALIREGLRRPSPNEFRVAALAGVAALGESTGEVEEAVRQRELVEDWYRLIEPIVEDDVDEPDFEARAVELARLQEEQHAARMAIVAEVSAIEANLARHWPPYAALVADRAYWEEFSEIEMVRHLLVRTGGEDDGKVVARTLEGPITDAAYQAIPAADRHGLAEFARKLLFPSEGERKN